MTIAQDFHAIAQEEIEKDKRFYQWGENLKGRFSDLKQLVIKPIKGFERGEALLIKGEKSQAVNPRMDSELIEALIFILENRECPQNTSAGQALLKGRDLYFAFEKAIENRDRHPKERKAWNRYNQQAKEHRYELAGLYDRWHLCYLHDNKFSPFRGTEDWHWLTHRWKR